MRSEIYARLCSWKEIFWGKALLIFGVLWTALGAWDLIKSELLPEKYQSWTVVAKTPHMAWHTWVIVFLVALLGILLEGAHAAIQRRDKANTVLQATGIGKTTMNRDWPGDWKLAEDGFRRYERSSVRADWFHSSLGPTEKWTLTGDTSDRVHDCEALCIQAGRLLTVSPMSFRISADLQSQKNDADRWLYFLKERYGLQNMMQGESRHEGQIYNSLGGSIRNIAATSARACIECGAKSFCA